MNEIEARDEGSTLSAKHRTLGGLVAAAHVRWLCPGADAHPGPPGPWPGVQPKKIFPAQVGGGDLPAAAGLLARRAAPRRLRSAAPPPCALRPRSASASRRPPGLPCPLRPIRSARRPPLRPLRRSAGSGPPAARRPGGQGQALPSGSAAPGSGSPLQAGGRRPPAAPPPPWLAGFLSASPARAQAEAARQGQPSER